MAEQTSIRMLFQPGSIGRTRAECVDEPARLHEKTDNKVMVKTEARKAKEAYRRGH